MKPIFLSLAAVAALALPATHALAGACGGGPIDTPDAMANHVVMDIYAGVAMNAPEALSYVESQFDPALSSQLPAPALASAWQAYQAPLGAFQSEGLSSEVTQGDLTVVTVPLQFAQGKGNVQVSVHPDLTIAAVTFLPAS